MDKIEIELLKKCATDKKVAISNVFRKEDFAKISLAEGRRKVDKLERNLTRSIRQIHDIFFMNPPNPPKRAQSSKHRR